ncbi:hypothetical protein Rvan_0283 [Rhodomicrobium vannielii ATCC 17100]|uniref:Uncharacterized protein n=1 Tax=Rhodomicrobium vannielii (strain ATCC 17100 / DSM 162 / LMG 4299 / NCIMB 10020 / ATH 3.1.1) TaxID=648757 RepID=E3I707_RHOVT|nr:hypothetical protein Rvan_0283 [Rhodomicrobium vannielii ATCC 17100]
MEPVKRSHVRQIMRPPTSCVSGRGTTACFFDQLSASSSPIQARGSKVMRVVIRTRLALSVGRHVQRTSGSVAPKAALRFRDISFYASCCVGLIVAGLLRTAKRFRRRSTEADCLAFGVGNTGRSPSVYPFVRAAAGLAAAGCAAFGAGFFLSPGACAAFGFAVDAP